MGVGSPPGPSLGPLGVVASVAVAACLVAAATMDPEAEEWPQLGSQEALSASASGAQTVGPMVGQAATAELPLIVPAKSPSPGAADQQIDGTSAAGEREDEEQEGDSEVDWMIRWADEEGKPLHEFFSHDSSGGVRSSRKNPPGGAPPNGPPPRGILVGSPPGPQTIDWGGLFNIWDYDENPWTPTHTSLLGPLSTFQEIKKALPPKLIYGLVLLVLIISAVMGPMAAAKNAKIASKRRQIAEAKREVAALEEQIGLLQEENAAAAAENVGLAATISSQRECLASLADLKGALHAPASQQQSAQQLQKRRTFFGPDWGLLSHPTEIRLRMLREWGELPPFLTLELNRMIRTLDVQLGALDAKAATPEEETEGRPSKSQVFLPIIDSAEELRKLLNAARATYSSLKANKTEAHMIHSKKRARKLLLYGLLLQRQQELQQYVKRQQQQMEHLTRMDKQNAMRLLQKRGEVHLCIGRYVSVARDAIESGMESTGVPADLATQFRNFVNIIGLDGLSAFDEELHNAGITDAPEKLAIRISQRLDRYSAMLPKIAPLEASLLTKLSQLGASDSLEQQLAAERLAEACEAIGVERDRLLESLSTALGDLAVWTLQTAKRQEEARRYADAVANGLEAISGMKPLLAEARKDAIEVF